MTLSQTAGRLDYDDVGAPRTVITGNQSCSWKASAPRRTLSVILWAGEDFFVDVYRERMLTIFRPIEVDGLPAVEQQSSMDSIFCNITIGIGPARAVDLSLSIDEGGDASSREPCAEARRVAEAIVATLPPA